MIFGKGERRRTIRTSSENLTKSAEIAAFWRVRTQSPVAKKEEYMKAKISKITAFCLAIFTGTMFACS